MKKIGLVVKADAKANKKADELQRWLRSKGVAVIRQKSWAPGNRKAAKEHPSAPNDLFCVFVLGGDGTFLSAVRWIGDQHIPILGIKFGEVGFLAEISEESLFSAAETILADQFALKPRMRLDVQVNREGKTVAQALPRGGARASVEAPSVGNSDQKRPKFAHRPTLTLT